MNTHKHVSTPWILVALCTSVILFCVVIIGSEIKERHTKARSTSVLPDRFAQIEAEDLSTSLNTRHETLGPDTYCLNGLDLSSTSKMSEWTALRTFLEEHVYEASGDFELQVRNAVTENPNATILSTCYFGEDVYVLQKAGEGEEFAGYEIFAVSANNRTEALGEFINPIGRTLTMRTDLFKEEALSISSRSENASYASWYYFKFVPQEEVVEQVESCELWLGDESSPYGEEPTLNCEYVYQF
jgi:hypothetical protein